MIVVKLQANGTGKVDRQRPLVHSSIMDFRVLLVFIQANEAIDSETLRRRIPDKWSQQIDEAVQRLINDGVLVGGRART